MTNPQLYPLEVNPATGEPFLRLRRHRNIILTPPRTDDTHRLLQPLNDENVHVWLAGSPYPYLLEHAEQWISSIKLKFDSILEELESARDDPRLRITDGCPVGYLREIKDDGTELFIGEISIKRFNYGELIGPNELNWDTKAAFEDENSKRPVGDPGIVWTIGDFLIASHHGRGIMSDTVDTLMHEWAIPRMNCQHLICSALIGNEGSVRVFEKNGFEIKKRVEEYKVVKGIRRGLVVLEWKAV
ncbi:hypothetical protein M378DRAFT_183008 [Amanita muscaria Koide BX008]|uniref:N-acetyltransferase domain-containing protein n=1 Tax=Amanita muscaria (strain Koide BX008) TaxID=946122 RepID=A0A0C2XB34_AMAMK|nr:hypothetical protein M378DRAFT_183008 [Amanita muscaria Koide BX008]